jgi:hypothetical protein
MYQYNYYELEAQKYNKRQRIQYSLLCGSIILMLFIVFTTINSFPIKNTIDKPHNFSVNLSDTIKIIDSLMALDNYIYDSYNEVNINTPSNVGINNSITFLVNKLKEIERIEEKFTFREVNKLKIYILESISKYKSKDQL